MKTLLKIIIGFGLILNSQAQSMERVSVKFNSGDNAKSTLNLNQKLHLIKGLHFAVSPQFGNQFISRIEAQKAKLDLKDYYDDFDFGFNLGLNLILKEQLHLNGLCNMGMLKFDQSANNQVKSCIVKFSIDYRF